MAFIKVRAADGLTQQPFYVGTEEAEVNAHLYEVVDGTPVDSPQYIEALQQPVPQTAEKRTVRKRKPAAPKTTEPATVPDGTEVSPETRTEGEG